MYVACIRVSMYAYKNCILVTGYLSTLHRPGNVIAVLHCIDLGAIATPGTSLPVDMNLYWNGQLVWTPALGL